MYRNFTISYRLLPLILLIWTMNVRGIGQDVQGDSASSMSFPTIEWYENLDSVSLELDSVKTLHLLLKNARKESKNNDYLAAVEYFTRSLNYLDEERDTSTYFLTKILLARAYIHLGYYRESVDHLRDAVKYYNDRKDTLHLATALAYLSRINLAEGATDLAKKNILKVAELNASIHSVPLRLHTLINQGVYLNQLQEYDKARQSLEKAISISKSKGLSSFYTLGLYELAKVYHLTGQQDEAVKALLKALEIEQVQNNPYLKRNIYKALAKDLEKLENYPSANLFLHQYTTLNDSLLNRERQAIINKLIVKYETRQKQKEIISLESEQKVQEIQGRLNAVSQKALLISLAAMFVAVFFLVLFYQNKLRSNQIILEQNEKINRQQLIELENAKQISSMESMVKGQELERNRIAKDLHDSLGGLLSTIKLHYDALPQVNEKSEAQQEFIKINQMLDLACSEVRTISSNLQPGALANLGLEQAVNDLVMKYQDVTEADIIFQAFGMETPIASSKAIHIYRIVQELLHNSIKHAEATEILVQLTEDQSELHVLIEDDGRGYDRSKIKRGMGAENILSRVHYLKAELNIKTAPGKGTSTLIIVPI